MKRIMLAAAMLCAVRSVCATDAHWDGTDGGALDVAANWRGSAKPDGTGSTYLHNSQSAALTMPTDNAMNFNATTFLDNFEGGIDLGAKAKSITATSLSVKSPRVELLCGTISASGMLNLESSHNRLLTLNGPDAVLNVGSAQIGTSRSGCSVNVLGGAKLTSSGGIAVGYAGNASFESAANALVVSGALSSCSASTLKIGAGASNSIVRVLNGGSLATSLSIYLGDGGANSLPPQHGNTLYVSNATLTQSSGTAFVGFYSSSSNKLEIVDGGSAAFANLTLGYDQYSSSGRISYGNSVVVGGTGSRLVVSGNVVVGNKYAANSSFTVSDGATVQFKGDVGLGNGSALAYGSTFTVDNATFDYAPLSSKTFCVGNNSSNCTLRVVNGGCFYATNSTATLSMGANSFANSKNGRIFVGSGSVLKAKALTTGMMASCVIEAENGDIEFSDTLYPMNYATIIVKGTNSHIHASTITVLRSDGEPTFRFEVPPEGLVGARPLVHTAYFQPNTLTSAQAFLVDVAEPADSVTETRTYVLFKLDGGTWYASDVYNHAKLTGYGRASLSYDNESGELRLTVKPKRKGLHIIFR